MRPRHLWLCVGTWGGCEPPVAPAPDLSPTIRTCEPGVADIQLPAPDAVGVDWQSHVELSMVRGDPTTWVATPTLELFDGEGMRVPALVAADANIAQLIPLFPLDPGHTYTARWFDGCDGQAWSFTTLGLQLPDDLSSLTGTTWRMDLRAASDIDTGGGPSPLAELIGDMLPASALWFAWYQDQLVLHRQFLAGDRTSPSQCQPGPSDGEGVQVGTDGALRVALPDLDYAVTQDGGTVRVTGRSLSLFVHGEPPRIALAQETATADLGSVALEDLSPSEGPCDILPSFGADCVACPDGRRECIQVRIEVTDLSTIAQYVPVVVEAAGADCRSEAPL